MRLAQEIEDCRARRDNAERELRRVYATLENAIRSGNTQNGNQLLREELRYSEEYLAGCSDLKKLNLDAARIPARQARLNRRIEEAQNLLEFLESAEPNLSKDGLQN